MSISLLILIGYNIYAVIMAINWEFNQKPKLVATDTGRIQASNCVIVTGYHTSDKFVPVVQYNYRANGTTFTSARIGYYPIEGCSVMDLYPLGKHVQVYYDPANPSYAFLEPGLGKSGLQSLISNIPLKLFVAIVTIISIPIGLWLLKKFNKIGKSKPILTPHDG